MHKQAQNDPKVKHFRTIGMAIPLKSIIETDFNGGNKNAYTLFIL